MCIINIHKTIKRSFQLTAILLTFLIFSNCDKNNGTPLDKEEPTTDSTFYIGVETDFVKVTLFDTAIVINPNGPYYFKEFDVDDDKVIDFRFHFDLPVHPKAQNIIMSMVNIEDSNFQIASESLWDTMYRCPYINADSVAKHTYFNYLSNYTCSSDSVEVIGGYWDRTTPMVYNLKDTLVANEDWYNDAIFLSYSHESHDWWLLQNDISYFIKEGNWNDQNMKYLVYNKQVGDKEAYGWFKLSVTNHYEITIYEHAIQKSGLILE